MSSSADQIPMDVSAIYLDNTSIQVSFTLPTGIVNPYYYYHVVAYDSSGNIYDTSGTTSPIVLYGLTESTTYNYYVETIQTSPSTPNISLRTAIWPTILFFYATDISYNATMLNWTGVDFSSVSIKRGTTDISYITMSTGVTTGKYYDSYDLSGNTVYYYYITPYVTTGGGTTVQTSILTKVAPIMNLSGSPTSDGSAIILSYTAARNTYNTIYYTAKTTNASDFSETGTTILLQNLSGNTAYSSYVIVTLDNSSSLIASSNTVTTTTAVQPPSGSVIFYDNSSIGVELYSKNTYSSISYSASAGTSSATGSSSTLLIQNLSGNTIYNISVSNTLNGNSALFASTYISDTITTNVQPPTNVTLFYVDSSSIAVSYTPGINSYNSIVSTGYATDNLGRTNTNTVNSTTSPLYITDLSGNTTYTATVSTTLDGSSSLFSIASTSISTKTGVRPPYNILLSFYDSSSISVSFSSAPNTYTSVLYDAYMIDQCGNSTNAQSTTSPIQVSGLSADTTYSFYIKITLDNSANLTAQSDSISGTTSGFPVNKVIYLSPISYNEITVNWAGIDISYVMVYRNSQSLGTDYITPYIDVDISGNTYYSYYVVPYLVDRGAIITGEPSATVSTTTPISPISDLSMVFYDSSSITVTFTPGRNSYTSYIYYIATTDDVTVNPVTSTSSPIQITELSGNTIYNITITTVIDSSLNNITSTTVSAKTNIQSPNNASVLYYDNSSITLSLGELPRNSYSNTLYYTATATDNTGYSISSYVDGSLYPSGIVITGLSGNTSYSITVATIVDSIYSNLFNIGNVRTGIKMPYNLAVSEIPPVTPSSASIVSFSFTEPSQSGNVYYIASNSIIDVSSSSSPILFTGLSGNTTYSFTLKTVIDSIEYVSPTSVSITTAIQTPVDVELLSIEDASFTVAFTVGRNTTTTTPAYYILRATDISNNIGSSSSSYTDISSNDGILCTYGYAAGSTYSIDILTVVDNSMVSYGGLFDIST